MGKELTQHAAPHRGVFSGNGREWLTRSVLVCAGAFLALCLLELGLRAVYPQYGGCDFGTPDLELGAVLKASYAGACIGLGHETTTVVRTNAQGFRQPILPNAKPPNVSRILMLGDSTTFGVGVDQRETIPAILQALLNHGKQGADTYEVINAGVPGYGTAQEWLLFRRWAARLQPDAVILLFLVTNDIQDNLCLDGRMTPCFTLHDHTLVRRNVDHRQPRGVGNPVSPLMSLHTYVFVQRRLSNLLAGNPWAVRLLARLGLLPEPRDLPPTLLAWYSGDAAAAGWQLTQALLDAILSDVRARGIELVLAILPTRPQTSESFAAVVDALYGHRPEASAFRSDPDRPQRLLSTWADQHGVAVVDVLLPLREATAVQPVNLADGHFNARGNAVIAREIYQMLQATCAADPGCGRPARRID